MIRRLDLVLAATAALAGSPAFAQETAPETPALPDQPAAVEIAPEPAAPSAAAEPGEPAVNPDEMADLLNSRQQITQGVTLTRTVDGKVIETAKETIVYSPDDPYRSSEAGQSPVERLKAAFAAAALTRKEALEEAKLDFVIADLDRNEEMTADEFVFLVKGWQNAEITGGGRSRFVDTAFHADEAAADAEHEAQARAEFARMAGADATLSRKAYMKAILADFKAADADDDDLLRGDELLRFRAVNRGETWAQ